MNKVYISEPWPLARCWVCGLEKPIVGVVEKPDGFDGLCCEGCWSSRVSNNGWPTDAEIERVIHRIIAET